MVWRSRRERIAEIADRWAARSAGQLSDEERIERDEWRKADPAHEDAWQRTQLLVLTTKGMPRPPEARVPSWRRSMFPNLALAGAASILVIGSGAYVLKHSNHRGSNPIASEYAAIGAPSHIQLTDGTFVDLDVGAGMQADFSGPVRAVLLERGTARFDVAHDTAHPFVVTAADRKVTAIGTRFEVALQPHGVVVTLLQGAIEVTRKEREPMHAPVRMKPGQRLTVDDAHETIGAVPLSDTSMATPHDVPSTSVAAIVAQANRTTSMPIRFADPLLGDRPVQGYFDTHDTAALAAQLGVAQNLVVTRTESGFLLSSH
jgi:transmembrane sensor